MKLLTTILATATALAVFGQDNVTEKHKLLIGVTVSSDICYRTLEHDGSSTTAPLIMDIRNDGEVPKFSYSTGLSLSYNLTQHWAIETGLQYSNKGFKFANSDLTFGDQNDPRYGFIYTQEAPVPTKVTFIDNFNYFDIPLRTIFSAGKRKLRFISSIGITTNILINATNTNIIEYEGNDTERKTQEQIYDYKTINFSPTASVGIDWQFADKFNLRVEPTFRYGLLKIIDAPITAYLWAGGLNLTCYYTLK
ncbi:MAG: PorT family protein [Bacteroidia bacterium]|jgi:hypothetical protein|nr:PorT family protein [Bacteroidia bacterium]